MIVYFDTNIYIGAKYHFNSGKFKAVQNLIRTGKIELIYTSATLGEIEKNLAQDVANEVTIYNKCVKKSMPIIAKENFNLTILDVEAVSSEMKKRVHDFFHQEGITEIPLSNIEAGELMKWYFKKEPPFEDQKPFEFKDAIMIHAIKQYYKLINSPIIIVSADKGFLASFRGSDDIICFNDLVAFLKFANASVLQDAVDNAVETEKVETMLNGIIHSLAITSDEYSDFECHSSYVTLNSAMASYIDVVNENDKKAEKEYTVISDISVDIGIRMIASYRDEDNSYFDKEEQRYLFEKRITEERIDEVSIDIPLQFDIKLSNGEAIVQSISAPSVTPPLVIEISDDTLTHTQTIEETDKSFDEVTYCSQCGKIIGREAQFFTSEYAPLCSKCIRDDAYGSVCPRCGLKYPTEMTINGLCEQCAKETD